MEAMEDYQLKFDSDDYSGLDGRNGENFEHDVIEQSTVVVTGDKSMETSDDKNEDQNEDERKIFVGGLSWETTAKDLRVYFENYGEVTSCTVKTDVETKQSRGFGFVVFRELETMKEVLGKKEHNLHGRIIDPKPANPREGIKKIFVGRLDPEVPEDDVKEYFGKFGKVAKVDFPFNKVREQRRAFCFVEFESDKGVKNVLEQESHKLGGQEVDVKKATPNHGSASQSGGRGGRGRWGGGNTGGWRGGPSGRGGWKHGGGWNQGSGYGGGGYGAYGQGSYNYGGYGSYGGYDSDYYAYAQGSWTGYDQGHGSDGYDYGSYDYGEDQGYDYGSYDYGEDQGYDYGSYDYGEDQDGSYGKTQKRGHSGGYHPYK